MLGLERIIEKIFEWGTELWPIEVIEYYDRGIKMRMGIPVPNKDKSIKILEPGPHWYWPFIDKIISSRVSVKTMDVPEQSVTTKDGQSVVVRGVLKYKVRDVAKLLLDVDSPEEAVVDMSQGILMAEISSKVWSACDSQDLTKQISTKIKREATKWGIELVEFTLTDLALMRSIRLLNSTR
jgi:regulator of protease activity HflC (stomatin/prohibitin superfamily)